MKHLKVLIKLALAVIITAFALQILATGIIKQELQWQQQHQEYFNERK
ncbi:MAG: hypothetical protein Q4A15_00995 [Prevotellaceae bacterium]|nr:hypothetical protein [Prevotellaceae bacterium]